MKTWSAWLFGIALCLPFEGRSQSTSETALLFSRLRPGGSARIQGMGGVQTSLGGDYSSAFSNPAGLGMFNRSELTISPGFHSADNTSNYLDERSTVNKTNLNIPGFSVVFQTDQNGRQGFLSGAFAISFNRVNNFNQSFSYAGRNKKNSIIDYFIEYATGLDPNSFTYGNDYFNTPTGLAYNNYLIEDSTFLNPNASKYHYLSVMGVYPDPNDIRQVDQQEDIKITGAQNQWNFSYGANLSDKIFIGAGVGFTSLRFTNNKSYRESNFYFDQDPSFKPLNYLALNEEIRISGSGINGTLGIIARPVEGVQLGMAYTSPTIFKLTDTYRASLATQWNNFDYFNDGKPLNNVSEETDDVISEYDLKTPGRLTMGATYFFQKQGFLSADVEFVNYAGAKYSSGISGISFDPDNKKIKSLYQNTVNYRLGGEYRYNQFRFRGGFAFMSDPFQQEQNNISRKLFSYSTGLGYRTEKFYIDFALVMTQGETSYRPYSINSADSPLVTLKNQTSFGMITLGFPF
jgi:hypothetical protein